VVAASKNRVVFSKALGKADVEQDVALTTASVHRLASLSKPITGTIIMDLVEQGKLELDASVRKYLPELPDAYQKVTLHISYLTSRVFEDMRTKQMCCSVRSITQPREKL